MPKLLFARPPVDAVEERRIRKLAGARHAPAVWTLDALTAAARAGGIDIARSQVRRILLAEGVRWRRPRSWAASADPEFAPKNPGRGVLPPSAAEHHGHRRRRARPGDAAHLR